MLLTKRLTAIILGLIIFLFISFGNCAKSEDSDFEFEFQVVETITQVDSHPPKVSSPAAVVIDTINGRILYDKNAFQKRQMASTTKMMTAILAIERGRLNDIVTVSSRAAYVGGSQAHLRVGEKIIMQDLLYALLLPSGNDAAVAIAEHIAGSVEEFVTVMDEKAHSIGAKNTKYGSPHGLDRDNYSTAYDLALIARYCLKNPTFANIVATKSKYIPRDGASNGSTYFNTNEMLDSYPGADGVKTGYTGPAGRCLVTSATKQGWQIVSVVLGANSTYQRSMDSQLILDYAFTNYPFITILPQDQRMNSVIILKGQQDRVSVINKGEICMHINDMELVNIQREFILPDQLTAPVKMGDIVGKVILKLGETPVGSCNLYIEEDVDFWTIDMNLKKILEQWIFTDRLLKQYIEKYIEYPATCIVPNIFFLSFLSINK